MKITYTALILIMVFTSCGAQEVDNTKPMYGEVEKSKELKEADEEFVKTCLTQYGSIDSAVIVHINLAWRYYYHDDLKTAMKRFNHAWLLNPEYPDSYFGFASLLETQGKNDDAKRFENIGIKKDLNNSRTENCYQTIADCKEQLKDIEGTIGAYVKLTKLDPKNYFAYKKIGYFQMQLGNRKDAINAYDKAIELDPKDAMTYNNRAYLNQSLKNYEAAISDYSNAIQLDPKYISAFVNRGITKMEINQFKGAKSDFESCIVLDPKAGELRRFLALSELELGENENACKNLELAFNLGDKVASQLLSEKCKK